MIWLLKIYWTQSLTTLSKGALLTEKGVMANGKGSNAIEILTKEKGSSVSRVLVNGSTVQRVKWLSGTQCHGALVTMVHCVPPQTFGWEPYHQQVKFLPCLPSLLFPVGLCHRQQWAIQPTAQQPLWWAFFSRTQKRPKKWTYSLEMACHQFPQNCITGCSIRVTSIWQSYKPWGW